MAEKYTRYAIGADHAGCEVKNNIKEYLQSKGCEVVDFGTHSTESVDYPDFARQVAESVVNAECQRGILVCGTGIGMAIAANKVRGIRAATCNDTYTARVAAEHNDANVLCVGARVVHSDVALVIVKEWRKHEYKGDRHQRRLDKISEIERSSVGADD